MGDQSETAGASRELPDSGRCRRLGGELPQNRHAALSANNGRTLSESNWKKRRQIRRSKERKQEEQRSNGQT